MYDNIAEKIGFQVEDYEKEEVYGKKEKTFNKTDYEYTSCSNEECTVYVNPRHHEGVLTKIIYAYPEDNYKVFPEVEQNITPGYKRFNSDENSLAKGVKLIPR